MIIAFDFERYLTQIFHLTMIQISSISPNQLINREYCAAINVRVLVFTPEQLKAITTLVVGLLRFRKKKKGSVNKRSRDRCYSSWLQSLPPPPPPPSTASVHTAARIFKWNIQLFLFITLFKELLAISLIRAIKLWPEGERAFARPLEGLLFLRRWDCRF